MLPTEVEKIAVLLDQEGKISGRFVVSTEWLKEHKIDAINLIGAQTISFSAPAASQAIAKNNYTTPRMLAKLEQYKALKVTNPEITDEELCTPENLDLKVSTLKIYRAEWVKAGVLEKEEPLLEVVEHSDLGGSANASIQ